MSSAWGRGSTRQWRRTRAAILDRDGHRCQLRIEGVCKVIADCVHHTEGKAVTGDDPAYLVASCTPCNLRVGEPNKGTRDPDHTPRNTWW